MTSDVTFSPTEWRRVGKELSQQGMGLGPTTAGLLGRLGRPIEGSEVGATAADLAVATICPSVVGVVAEMLDALSQSLVATGGNLAVVADEYEATEQEHEDLAAGIVDATSEG